MPSMDIKWREGDEGLRETWGRDTVYHCPGSNTDGDRVAPGAHSRESGGQEGQSFRLPVEIKGAPGKLQAHPIPCRGAVKGAAKPQGAEVPTSVSGSHSLRPPGCSATGCWAGQDWPLWGLLQLDCRWQRGILMGKFLPSAWSTSDGDVCWLGRGQGGAGYHGKAGISCTNSLCWSCSKLLIL